MLTEQEKHEILQRADEVLAAAEASEDESAERRERIALGGYRDWQPPQEPPRATTTQRSSAMTKNERNEILATVGAMIRQQVAQALKAREAALADAIGQALAEERAKFREAHAGLVTRIAAVETCTLDTAVPILDLRVERARRSGNAA